ncbi:MAG TPA: GyrI-like domain-containing protein [Vicinamibacterales bacterium]|nr:GyrI-like domain-containing protein [Vicinamibacterales bacterium]
MSEPALHTIKLERLAAVPLAVVRRQAQGAALARVVPECCGLVWNALRAQGLRGGRHVAVYRDDAITLDVGVEFDGPFDGAGEVVASATPAGLAASTIHLGPYGGLGAAHDAVRQWCESHGHRLAGPRWEIYGHWQPEWNEHPSRIRTDVFYLLGESPIVNAIETTSRPEAGRHTTRLASGA